MTSSTFKSNLGLQIEYVTGVMQVTKVWMFFRLNNLWVDNVFSKRSNERLVFTENEVKEILSCYGRPEKFDEVRERYDGYRSGDAEVYNPFSVMSYVARRFAPANHWTNTSEIAPLK